MLFAMVYAKLLNMVL